MTYRTCPECGAHLDPEEKCDCQKTEESEILWDFSLMKQKEARQSSGLQ